MRSSKVAIFVFLGIAVAAAIIISLANRQVQKNTIITNIKTFADCAKAGYPIMESYPRQCSLPNGKFFIETSTSEK